MIDPEYLPLSLLSQIGYCPRRAGLLLNERQWEENADTARGRAEHERVHTERVERRGDHIKLYEFTVFSEEMSLLGKCDQIEAERDEDGCRIPAADFPVRLYPVEYKHGIVRDEEEYKLQLCAQAMCLEEMFDTSIPRGALFFISAHRRLEIELDDTLRTRVRKAAHDLRRLREDLTIPAAVYSAKCRRCSLSEVCMPKAKTSADRYMTRLRAEAVGELDERGEEGI